MQPHDPDDAAAALGVLGITALEEAVYRSLLRTPGSTAALLAQRLDVNTATIDATILDLERKGFATHTPERVPRLFASPPDIAIEALLLARQNELLGARRAIASLQNEQPEAVDGSPVVEIIDADPAAQAQPYAQSHRMATTEVLCLVRPPFLVSTPSTSEDTRADARRRGVRYRNIVHPDTLQLPGWPEALRRVSEAGEEFRLLSQLPFKMIVADRELGLLPLRIDEPHGAIMLLRSSAVLDALCELFEALWKQAVPIGFDADGVMSTGTASPYPQPLAAMIPLLASGVNDKGVAERLGISDRTLMRRIETLYGTLGARTRFQAGWMAALQTIRADVNDA